VLALEIVDQHENGTIIALDWSHPFVSVVRIFPKAKDAQYPNSRKENSNY
jgi:hypothetical protein